MAYFLYSDMADVAQKQPQAPATYYLPESAANIFSHFIPVGKPLG